MKVKTYVCAGVHADGEMERPLREANLQDVSRDPHFPCEFLCKTNLTSIGCTTIKRREKADLQS